MLVLVRCPTCPTCHSPFTAIPIKWDNHRSPLKCFVMSHHGALFCDWRSRGSAISVSNHSVLQLTSVFLMYVFIGFKLPNHTHSIMINRCIPFTPTHRYSIEIHLVCIKSNQDTILSTVMVMNNNAFFLPNANTETLQMWSMRFSMSKCLIQL